jgi:NADH dehydrogenase [ubiquinone] 1 alpha subcomplex assembly factor 7
MNLQERLRREIAESGPMSVARFMTACLHDPKTGYYATRPGIGRDFITAPEVSQMFGELVGLWCAQTWMDLGAPARFSLIEFGPGRGTLMADALRACRIVPGFVDAADIVLVESSPKLRDVQRQALAPQRVRWASGLQEIEPGPTIMIGNEFLDCLPIRQFVRAADGWRERLVGVDGERLVFGLGPRLSAGAPDLDAAEGAIFETSPAAALFADAVAERLEQAPGRALFVDYGADAPSFGDTLQALRDGEKIDPLAAPGESDLTAHVQFPSLCARIARRGLHAAGPMQQGAWLEELGLGARAAALSRARPDKADDIAAALRRLTHADEMGHLFKAICWSSAGLPPPAGFQP